MTKTWLLEWSHGRSTIHAAGGAIGHTELRLDDARWVAPFHEAPWVSRGEVIDPPMLANLRGEWACLPFGRSYGAADELPEPWAAEALAPVSRDDGPLVASDHLLHGYGSNADWRLVSQSAGSLIIAIEYPQDSAIERITRHISAVGGTPAMDISVEIVARRACARPFGFHPNFALRGRPESFRIEPGPFAFGLTHPTGEPGVSTAKPDTRFADLSAVPLRAGGTGHFDLLPFAQATEEIVQLCGIDGSVRLVDDAAKAVWSLTWDARTMPSCLLWMSNRGRRYPPWNGENLCVGVEPVVSAFDLGTSIAAAANPIARDGVPTAVRLEPSVPARFGYRIAGSAHPTG